MFSWPHIQSTFENCLITVKCQQWADGSRPTFLLGLAEMKKRGRWTEGWLLIVSGDPLVADGIDKYLPNKVNIEKLHLSWEQKKALTDSSTIRDGNVYLYAGQFSMGKCVLVCKEDERKHENLDMLKLLSDLMCYNLVELEPRLVIPYKIKNLPRIYKPRCLKGYKFGCGKKQNCHHHNPDENAGQRPPPPTPVGENQNLPWTMAIEKDQRIVFLFRRVGPGPQAVMEIECPANHSGYTAELFLMETFYYRENVLDKWGRDRITRVLEQDAVHVPSSFASYQYRGVGHSGRGRIVVPLKTYQLPIYADNHRKCDGTGEGEHVGSLYDEQVHTEGRSETETIKVEGFATKILTASSKLSPTFHYCYPHSNAAPTLLPPARVLGCSAKVCKGAVCAFPVRMALYKMMLSP